MAYPSRATIGDACDYPATSAGIKKALDDNRRWLVFTDTITLIDEPIILDQWAHASQLRLEGAGPNVTHLLRKFDGPEPLIGTTRGLWRLYFHGLHFVGDAAYPTPAPLTEFACIQLSLFKLCKWQSSTADGFRAAFPPDNTRQFDTTRFSDCWFDDNQGNGASIFNGADVYFTGGGFQRNKGGGLYYRAPDKNARGLLSMHQTHLELNGPNGYHGINLDNVQSAHLSDMDVYYSHILLNTNTSGVQLDNLRLVDSQIRDFGRNNLWRDTPTQKFNNRFVTVGTSPDLTGCG